MEKLTNSYETLFIVDAQLAEDETKSVIEKFTSLIAANGTIGETSEWGKRRLAYPINDKNEGYYVVVEFNASADLPKELDRRLKISDNVMRHIIINADAK